MRTVVPLLLLCFGFSLSSQAPPTQDATANPKNCAPLGAPYLRTTLYFGLNRKIGSVTEGQWKSFLRDEVTPRFPKGLTVWEADGQWRGADGHIGRERAKVLLLVHEDSREVTAALTAIIEAYKHKFEQESVLWETAGVCAAF